MTRGPFTTVMEPTQSRKSRWKRIALIVGGGLLLPTFALLGLLLFPELWFRTPVLKRALPWALRQAGLNVEGPITLEAHAARRGWRTLTLKLSVGSLGFAPAHPPEGVPLKGQVGSLSLEASLLWPSWPIRLQQVGRVQAQGLDLTLLPTPAKPATEPERPGLPLVSFADVSPEVLREFRVGSISIESSRFSIQDAKGALSLALELSAQAPLDSPQLTIVAHERVSRAEGRVDVPLFEARTLKYSALNVNAFLPLDPRGHQKLTLDAHARDCQSQSTCVDGKLQLPASRPRALAAELQFRAHLAAAESTLNFHGRAQRLAPWLDSVRTADGCRLTVRAPKLEQYALDLACALDARLEPPPGGQRPLAMKRLQLRSDARVNVGLAATLTRGNEYAGMLKLDSRPVVGPVVKGSLEAKSDFRGRISEGLNGFHQNSAVAVELNVEPLERAVALLHDTDWAIPAPLNNLRGGLKLALRSQWKDWETTAPFEFTSALRSPEQAFETKATGTLALAVRPRFGAELNADWVLAQVRLSAPRVDPKKLPRFFPDSQILTAEQRAKRDRPSTPSAFKYRVTVHTADPLRVDTDLVRDPLLFDVQARLASEAPLEATISVRPVPFEVFRRRAVIESFQYRVNEAEGESLAGRVRVHSADAVVFVNLKGDSERVRVRLTSEPAVPEDQLWAVLLFGEPMDSLDIEQQDTSQSTERALSKGALGLSSLYAFASTPVERVDYDPATQRVAVRFRVQEGTSLEVGRGEDEVGSLGLRKRLGKGWTINAKVSESEGAASGADTSSGAKEKSAKAGATLEWSTRY